MRLLQANDLMQYFNEGKGQPRATVMLTEVEYHGKEYPLECTISRIVEAETTEKTIMDITDPDLPRIRKEAAVSGYAAEPLGVCWPSDIERVLTQVAPKADAGNPNLRAFFQALTRIEDFKKRMEAFDARDKMARNPFQLV